MTPVNGELRTCKNDGCENTFWVSPSRLNIKLFCSIPCALSGRDPEIIKRTAQALREGRLGGKGTKYKYPELANKDLVQEKVSSGMLMSDIAKELGCSIDSVRFAYKKFNIDGPRGDRPRIGSKHSEETRKLLSERAKARPKRKCPEGCQCGLHNRGPRPLIESPFPELNSKEEVIGLIERYGTTVRISEAIGSHYTQVIRAMDRYGVERPPKGKNKSTLCLPGCECGRHNSPPNKQEPVTRQCHYPGCEVIISTSLAWAHVKSCSRQHQYIPKPGNSKYPDYPPEWEMIRIQIRERDGHRCKICGGLGRRLEVHHIDNVVHNVSFDNLITLCSTCHHQGHKRKVGFTVDLKSLI